jgi:hypothetical protein
MTTRSDEPKKTTVTKSLFARAVFFFLIATGQLEVRLVAANRVSEVKTPSLQRMCIQQYRSYTLVFATQRGPEFPALLVEDWGQNEESVKRFHLFGMTARPPFYPPLRAVRWDAGDDVIYALREFPSPAGPPKARVLRFPKNALVERDEFLDPLDRGSLPPARTSPKSWKAPHYVDIEPVHSAMVGVIPAAERSGMHDASDIHYDIRALDAERLELYMTADGKLQRWLFDGKEWTLQKDYAAEIKGPFLVCGEGNAAVAECDGQWCLIEPLDADEPALHPIVPRVEDEALLVIEDRVTGKTYFEQGYTLYDDRGRILRALPRVPNTPTKVTVISDFVRSLRPE